MPTIFRRSFLNRNKLRIKNPLSGAWYFSDSKSPKERIVLRKSIYCIIFSFAAIEIFFDSLYLFVKLPPIYLHLSVTLQNNLMPLYFVIFVILSAIKFFLMLTIGIKWISNHYEINKREIRHCHGILSKKEEIYLCDFAQEVEYSQTLFGRIFNYGTVDIFNPAVKETIVLDSIPNPAKYAEIIKTNLPDNNSLSYISE